MTLFDRLRNRDGFTDTDRALAEYIVAHPDAAADLNIGELAKVTHTSNAAVTRFCHRLGLEGYRAFRLELARELERSRQHVFDVNPDQPFMEESTTQEMMDSILNLSRQALEDAHRSIKAEEVARAAQLISDARRVVLYATGDSRVSLEGFSNLLTKVDIPCIQGVQNGDDYIVSHILGSSDVAVVVTYSGMLFPLLSEPFKGLRSRGCKMIAITANESVEEYVPGVECVLTLPKGETRRGRIATYYSQACIRFVLNCIYGEIFTRNWQRSMAVNERYTERESRSW